MLQSILVSLYLHTTYNTRTVSNHQTLMALNGHIPSLGANVFVAPSASVLGRVQVGENSSIWYNAVLRGRDDLSNTL